MVFMLLRYLEDKTVKKTEEAIPPKSQNYSLHVEVMFWYIFDSCVDVFCFVDALPDQLFSKFGAQTSPKQVPFGAMLLTCAGSVEHVKMLISHGRCDSFEGWRVSEITYFW